MASVVETFRAVVESEGLRAGIRWLNRRVPYRFTAIFAFDGDMLRNLCLVDKEDESVTTCADLPITDSYCIYVLRSNSPFGVEEASQDRSVEGHPKQRSFQCYYGIPLFGGDGRLLGTVCHFDAEPIRVSDDTASVLDDVGPLIASTAFKN
jgi:GAF domain-containing protein